VDVYILRLRQKLEADPANPTLIRSVRGFGYSFDESGPSNNSFTGLS
jgi:DNA-binding response OmpR family regulator